jgi:hypothetical protein
VRHRTSASGYPQANFKTNNVKAHVKTGNSDAHATPGPLAARCASSLTFYNYR